MIPKITVFGAEIEKSALKNLPDLVNPALAGLARTLRRGIEAQGITLEQSAGPDGVTLTDTSPDSFAREFGTLESPANPVLSDTLARFSAGLLPEQGEDAP